MVTSMLLIEVKFRLPYIYWSIYKNMSINHAI